MSIKKNVLFFYVSFCLMYGGLIFEHTAICQAEKIKMVCYLLSIGCLFFSLIEDVIEFPLLLRKDILKWSICILVFLLSLKSRDYYIFMVMILGLRATRLTDKEIEKLLVLSIILSCCFLIFIPLFCMCGLIPNLNSVRGIGGSDRFTYGFNHSQVFPIILTYVFLIMFSIKRKISVHLFVIVQLLEIFIYKVFDARNAIVTVELFFVIFGVFALILKTPWMRDKNKNIINICKCGIYISSLISFASIFLYKRGNEIALLFDEIISHRIREPLSYFEQGYVNLLPFRSYSDFYEIELLVNKNIDNSIYYIAIRYGVLFLFIFCLFYNRIFDYFKRNNNMVACFALFTISISIMITNTLTSYFLPFLIIGMREVWLMGIVRKDRENQL